MTVSELFPLLLSSFLSPCYLYWYLDCILLFIKIILQCMKHKLN